jgi:hypothetical protein
MLSFAALLNFARHTRLEDLDSLLSLRRCNIDAVFALVRRPFPRLRKLYAYVKSRSTMRSLITMLAAAASAVVEDPGEEEAAPALESLGLELPRGDSQPFAYMLVPLSCCLRELWLYVLHTPGATPCFSAADLRALAASRSCAPYTSMR